jgi:formiminotetrahydrofolate cyclodeaminase
MNLLDETMADFMERVSDRTSAPGGGSVAATSAALAASLAMMAARFSKEHMEDAEDLADRADSLRSRVSSLIEKDAEVYGRVLEAKRSGGDVRAALSDAADVPMEAAEAAAEVSDIASRLAEKGNPNLRGDALTAGFLAEASVRASAKLAEMNLEAAGMDDDPRIRRAQDLERKATEK